MPDMYWFHSGQNEENDQVESLCRFGNRLTRVNRLAIDDRLLLAFSRRVSTITDLVAVGFPIGRSVATFSQSDTLCGRD